MSITYLHFREVIKECPLALEAIKSLLQMGVSSKEIQVNEMFMLKIRDYFAKEEWRCKMLGLSCAWMRDF